MEDQSAASPAPVSEQSPDFIGGSDKKRVLEPFIKADAARHGPNDGFGLGLPIVAEIVQAHGGRLHLLDREPDGLLVRLELPVE
ncbi:ATP-binding protein [Rhizobium sp. TRM95796]|uniref:ATP-binding protein n=1 Tax=Rhizobium sp. TRM95796 TaxID=2979862 RepID=UPI0021E939E0|nr:ATP-binding protein [Rhizobium sp. TRM95796]MCV3768798.1 hypothetical protein [Rhizobium sp. TRM95796]